MIQKDFYVPCNWSTYTIENGKAKHYKKTYPIYEEFDEFAFEYGGDYLSQIKGIIESEYPTTENFIYVGGKLTQYKWIDEEFDNVYALLDFTYDQQLNNLNLDLFGIILADYFENIEDLFLYDITGKRSVYLPEKVKVSGIDDEDGEKYEYEIFYENWFLTKQPSGNWSSVFIVCISGWLEPLIFVSCFTNMYN